MTTAVATSTPAPLVIKLPAFAASLSIEAEIVAARDALLVQSKAITAVGTSMQYTDATALQGQLTKASNSAETKRLAMCKPFTDTTKVIKTVVDKFRQPMEDEKERLRGLNNVFITAERAREERQRREQEEADRARIEKELAANEAAEDLGFAPAPTPVAVVPDQPTVAAAPKSEYASVPEVVEFTLVDAAKVPVAFYTFDERKVNQYIRDNKDSIKSRIKDDPANAEAIISGIKFTVRFDVRGR